MADYSFAAQIKKHLDEVAEKDKLFAVTYAKKNKSIDECVNYIIGEARKRAHSGVAAISDADVYNMAIHYYDEDDIKVSVHDAMGTTAKVAHATEETATAPKKAKRGRKPKAEKKEPIVSVSVKENDEDEGLNIPLFD